MEKCLCQIFGSGNEVVSSQRTEALDHYCSLWTKVLFPFHFLRFFGEQRNGLSQETKQPLLKRNKIMSVHIHNDTKLVGSYAFLTTALSKFPAILNIEEEKKGVFLTLLITLILKLCWTYFYFLLLQTRYLYTSQTCQILQMV